VTLPYSTSALRLLAARLRARRDPYIGRGMSTSANTAAAAGGADVGVPTRDGGAVRVWLYLVALLIVAMVAVGGATRLTDSGLSITEWKPIHGVIPPRNEAEWQEEFARYQQIPEYQQLNRGMSLADFKGIFWWEWTHRLLGRLIGVAVLVPMIVFFALGRISRQLAPKLVAIFILGGVQGAVGWWMVASGLATRTDVSQYRLAVHLTFACAILAYVLWVARGLSPPGCRGGDASDAASRRGDRRTGLSPDLSRRARGGSRRRAHLQHLAADGRGAGSAGAARRPAGVAERL
jgi:hypothetical protein